MLSGDLKSVLAVADLTVKSTADVSIVHESEVIPTSAQQEDHAIDNTPGQKRKRSDNRDNVAEQAPHKKTEKFRYRN